MYDVRVPAVYRTATSAASEQRRAAATGSVPLSAEFGDVPESHDGENEIEIQITFSETVATHYMALRDRAVQAVGGTVLRFRRIDGPGDLRQVVVMPHGNGHVTVILPASRDCSSWQDVCAAEEKPLSNRLELTIPGTN